MFCGRKAATPFTLSAAKRLLARKSFHFCRASNNFADTFYRILFIQRFKIQIQRPNRRVITEAYEAKSEEMGGIGEKLGGVA